MAKPVKESDALKVLRKTVLAQYLDEKKALAGFADQFETTSIKEKNLIFNQGETNDSLYLVMDGSVELEVWTDTNPKYVEPKKDDGDDDIVSTHTPLHHTSHHPPPAIDSTLYNSVLTCSLLLCY